MRSGRKEAGASAMSGPRCPGVEAPGADSLSSVLSTSSVETSLSLGSVRTRIFKIIVIGDSNVGKTCLTFRFCGGLFPERTEATIGVDFRERTVELEGERIKLQLWDTAGQERFRKSMVSHYYRNAHAVVFVYDVTSRPSFLSLPSWLAECERHLSSSDAPRVLVGNKCDLKDKVEVPTSLAQKFADAHGMAHFETSAKEQEGTGDHAEAIFLTLAHRLRSQRTMAMPRLFPAQDTAINLADDKQGADNGSYCYC
ncbi:ras-related protein Rab-33B-like [Lampetra planeri]